MMIPIMICGEYRKGFMLGQFMAQVYVNYLGDDPHHFRQPWLPKRPMGLEEFFEFNMNATIQQVSNACYNSGAWHGFLHTTTLFRKFSTKTLGDLEREVGLSMASETG